jgi:hypothetical protein
MNKITTVKFDNDSLLTPCVYTRIFNDTLIFLSGLKNVEGQLFLSEIKNIEYNNTTNYSHISGRIILRNGEEIFADNIETYPDSTLHFNIRAYRNIPISNVKEVSYKNTLLGAGSGFLIGSAFGLFVGLLVEGGTGTKDSDTHSFYYYLTIQTIGSIAGMVWGLLQGYSYIYKFSGDGTSGGNP